MHTASAPSHWRAPAPADPNAITAVAGPLQPHPDAVARAAAFGRAAVALLDRLIAADDPFRAKAPVIAQRVRPPHFRPLRSVLVPRTRVEIAKRPVLDLEGDVVELRNFIDHEIDRVVIGSATQERKRLIAPIRHAKAQYVGIELHNLLHILLEIRHVP